MKKYILSKKQTKKIIQLQKKFKKDIPKLEEQLILLNNFKKYLKNYNE